MRMWEAGTEMFAVLKMVIVASAAGEMQQPGGKESDLKNQAENRYRFPPFALHEHHFHHAESRHIGQPATSFRAFARLHILSLWIILVKPLFKLSERTIP